MAVVGLTQLGRWVVVLGGGAAQHLASAQAQGIAASGHRDVGGPQARAIGGEHAELAAHGAQGQRWQLQAFQQGVHAHGAGQDHAVGCSQYVTSAAQHLPVMGIGFIRNRQWALRAFQCVGLRATLPGEAAGSARGAKHQGCIAGGVQPAALAEQPGAAGQGCASGLAGLRLRQPTQEFTRPVQLLQQCGGRVVSDLGVQAQQAVGLPRQALFMDPGGGQGMRGQGRRAVHAGVDSVIAVHDAVVKAAWVAGGLAGRGVVAVQHGDVPALAGEGPCRRATGQARADHDGMAPVRRGLQPTRQGRRGEARGVPRHGHVPLTAEAFHALDAEARLSQPIAHAPRHTPGGGRSAWGGPSAQA